MLCTYFDIKYAHNGLALIRSIRKYLGDEPVVILALDSLTEELFKAIGGEDLFIITVADLDRHVKGLSEVLSTRGRQGRMWSYSAPLCRYVLDMYGVAEYIDADCWFMSALTPVREECASSTVGIVSHRFSPTCPSFLPRFGLYNVSYTYFNNRLEGNADEVCNNWLDHCMTWVPSAAEPTFSDQVFLNNWPEKYHAHIVQHLGANLAPWNQDQYMYSTKDDKMLVNSQPVIWYHFHQHKVQCKEHIMSVTRGVYKLHPVVVEKIYQPYEQELMACLNMIMGYFKKPVEELWQWQK